MTAGDQLSDVSHTVECSVDHETSNQTIRCAVAEGNEHESDESRDSVANVSPIDAGDLSHHQAPNLSLCQII